SPERRSSRVPPSRCCRAARLANPLPIGEARIKLRPLMAGDDKTERPEKNGRKNGAQPAASAATTEAPPDAPAAEIPSGAPTAEGPSTATGVLTEPQREPRQLHFLFISKWGLIHDLAWEVKKEGHEVRYHIMSKADREVGDGFVDKVDRWEDSKDWADIIVFDDCEFGNLPDKLRKEGRAVVGGTPY